ncbi:MAG TPA: flagellar basal-body MS-ring/collar protein FliF [Spirochaetota bacterium]|jgi:flagellar M-ring protein FliF|nr:flagellar M-ring protein FliF [Spirochaetota bacterium]OQA96704.1 MAG: Flagellar M-ring protein [Spirochaetes bacterium ADurb.Bin218]HOK00914.1 flagellar basal-body MS-ring/collar protein FliF [Spirochaetota bacterium]HOK91250.1 flagellar basal-body MS-ring/collar protein FliF [Spirochaetota bacterium]HON16425.1 flagellar basal-body MS-ring/collar protein FliF [Spirochaetota bacterium]
MDFLKKLFEQGKEIYNKLSRTKRIIIAVVVVVVIASFGILFTVSSSQPNILLFEQLSSDDFGQITKKLDEMGYKYETAGTNSIYVKPQERPIIVTRLAQENMLPKGIPGFKLFDTTSWTETDRELDVKYMRALRGEIQRHIESLQNIEKADVEIAMSEDSLYSDKDTPYTAAVTVHLAPGYEKLSTKEIKGIVYLVSRAVGPRLKPENVTVTDNTGKIISDFDDEFENEKKEYTIIEFRRKIEEQARVKLLKEIRDGLERIYSSDRIQIVRLNMDFNWDKITEEQTEHTPITMVPDDPKTPYSERKVQDSLVISEKSTEENFKGHGWNPQGPAGTEGNTPPGYKASDDQYAQYDKKENIKNHAINKTIRNIARDPYDITRVSVAIAIDGQQDLPRKADGEYDLDPTKKPVQIPLTEDELRKAENIVKKAINFDEARGDQVAVENIMFDRSAYWNSIREEYRKKEQLKMLLLASLIGLVALFVGFILFRAIQKELERRRRAREEALALEQQRMREAALRAAEEEGIDVELSLEERARLELQQSALQLAKERPDDVAQLLRTWLAEE